MNNQAMVAILTWDAIKEAETDKVAKELAELISKGWHIASHTTIATSTQLIHTVIVVTNP